MNILSTFQNIFAPPRDLILIILAAWIGLTLSERRASRHHVNLDSLSNLLLVSLVGFVIGGRVLYALENLSIFAQSPASILSLNTALFDQWGGLDSRGHHSFCLWTAHTSSALAIAGRSDPAFRYIGNWYSILTLGFRRGLRQSDKRSLGHRSMGRISTPNSSL